MPEHADVAVVGAGIVGLAVAWRLACAGRRVVVFERHPQARGASVRNFGMLWPIGQPAGPRRATALRSRQLWLEALDAAGIWHTHCGSLHVARHDDERRVLEEFAKTAQDEGFACELIDGARALELSRRLQSRGLEAALWSAHEVGVDPRDVLRRLPPWLEREHGVRICYDTLVTDCDDHVVSTSRGAWEVDRCVICVGDELQTLFPEALAALDLTPCKLQMMRTDPVGVRLGPMLAAGLTLTHYDSFRACPSLPALRERLRREWPLHARYGIHVLVSQTEAGALTLGDSHEYGDAIEPFDSARIDALILDYLDRFFDATDLRVSERWHGVYVKHPTEPYVTAPLAPWVTALVGFGGAGMTLSFGAADAVVHACV